MMDPAKNKEICAIVKVRSKKEIHRANLTDDFQIIRQMLTAKLSEEFLTNWIKKKQQETYVHIDPAWRGCDFEYPNWLHE